MTEPNVFKDEFIALLKKTKWPKGQSVNQSYEDYQVILSALSALLLCETICGCEHAAAVDTQVRALAPHPLGYRPPPDELVHVVALLLSRASKLVTDLPG